MIFHSAYDPANSAAQRHQRSARELPDVRLRKGGGGEEFSVTWTVLMVEKNEIKLIVDDPNVNS